MKFKIDFIHKPDRKIIPSGFTYCNFFANVEYYKEYIELDFEYLLNTLAKIKGNFILISCPSPLLDKYAKKYKWNTVKIEWIPVFVSLGRQKMKTEVLTRNITG